MEHYVREFVGLVTTKLILNVNVNDNCFCYVDLL